MRKLLVLTLLSLFAAGCFASIVEPKDKIKTFSETLMLLGSVEGYGTLEANNQPLAVDSNGMFSCGLVLNPGKNLVEVRRGGQKQRIRILRLVTYPDIEAPKHWAEAQIVYTSTLGLVEGYPDGNFYPNLPVSRGEFATWLARVKKLPAITPTQDVFFDVPKEHWRSPYIKAVVDKGYMQPETNNLFGVDDPISRSDAAEIAVHTEGFGMAEKIKALFVDVPEEERTSLPIYIAQEKGLVIGVSKKMPIYDPERSLTRAEAATMMSRFWASQYGIRDLADYEIGYDANNFCSLDNPPVIDSFSIEPDQIALNQDITIKLKAHVAPRGKFFPISKVKVDLKDIGGLPDAEMFDDGTHGDEVSGDATYSLNILFTPSESGSKTLVVTATDRLGWEGKTNGYLLVIE
jgi:hypothetical protein